MCRVGRKVDTDSGVERVKREAGMGLWSRTSDDLEVNVGSGYGDRHKEKL